MTMGGGAGWQAVSNRANTGVTRAPNGYDDDLRSRAAGFDHGVQHFVDAGAFECDVHAFAVGQFFHFFDDIDFGRVEDVVDNAGFAGFVFAEK